MKVVDMHCDTISVLYHKMLAGEEADLAVNDCMVDLAKMEAGDYCLQNFALFTELSSLKESPLEYGMKLLDAFYTFLEAYADRIGIVKSWKEIEENRANGKMSALLTIEEGAVCQGDLALLRNFYRLGVRMMTLTWNYPNELGFPNRQEKNADGRTRAKIDDQNGLTKKGIAFVEEMERLGMIVDISHLNDAGIWDVFSHTKKPFVASHSNARGICPHPRNLSDEMIRALAERGGVMGINFCAAFLETFLPGEETISRVKDMVRHIAYIKNLGGISCIGLGSDFDGIGGTLELKDASDLPILAQEMERAGFSTGEIEAVFSKNVLRLYREILH